MAQQFPVLADTKMGIYAGATPWDGNARPGKCVLSPKMEILFCDVGHGADAAAFEVIKQHRAANP